MARKSRDLTPATRLLNFIRTGIGLEEEEAISSRELLRLTSFRTECADRIPQNWRKRRTARNNRRRGGLFCCSLLMLLATGVARFLGRIFP